MSSIKKLKSGTSVPKEAGNSDFSEKVLPWIFNDEARLEAYGGKFDTADTSKAANQKQNAKESRYR